MHAGLRLASGRTASSYETRMDLWEKAGEKAGKPRLAYENHAMPVFYRDVMYREEQEGNIYDAFSPVSGLMPFSPTSSCADIPYLCDLNAHKTISSHDHHTVSDMLRLFLLFPLCT